MSESKDRNELKQRLAQAKRIADGALDPLTKELIYVAISMTNQCGYCIASHIAGARSKGMTDDQLKELIAVVGFANANNRVVAGYQVEIDERFRSAS